MKTHILIALLFITYSVSLAGQGVNKHNFPIPEKNNQRLFYLQRSLNKNTIVYDANFDKNGALNIKDPVKVYWIRFDEDSREMPLRMMEKNFAFGVNSVKLHNQTYDYKITLAATSKRSIYLKQVAPFKVEAYLKIDGKYSKLDHIFVQSDPNGLLTRLEYVELYGEYKNSQNLICERINL